MTDHRRTIREALAPPRQEGKVERILKDAFARLVGRCVSLGIRVLWPFERALRRYDVLQLGHAGRNVVIHAGAVIYDPKTVWVGDNVAIGAHVVLNGPHVKIGANTMIASRAMIITVGHDYNVPLMRDFAITKPVEIGENVWIGMAAIILPGVKIGSGAVIGAGAVVTKDVPNDAIVVGVAAHVLRDRFSKVALDDKET